MKRGHHFVSSATFLAVGFLLLTLAVRARQQNSLNLKIEDVMSAQELKDTGVSGLNAQQRKALNAWLNRYTGKILTLAAQQFSKPTAPAKKSTKSDCVPAIESTIEGDFNGWDGDTIFKLDNGQIWEQAEYDYMYSYSYRPDVTIYQAAGGCRMKVEDEDETIFVRRIR